MADVLEFLAFRVCTFCIDSSTSDEFLATNPDRDGSGFRVGSACLCHRDPNSVREGANRTNAAPDGSNTFSAFAAWLCNRRCPGSAKRRRTAFDLSLDQMVLDLAP